MTVGISKIDSLPPLPMSNQDAGTMAFCTRISSELWQGTVDGRVACVWGLIPPTLMSNQAYLWLYTTDLVKEHQFLFVRYSQRMVEKLLEHYESIVGHVQVDAPRSRQWLKWLGAEFGNPKGSNIPFVIRKRLLNG